MILFRLSIAIASLIVLLPAIGLAQRENCIWYFGGNAGLDFNGVSPRPLFDSRMSATEGCASIADRRTGELLFYTDGGRVWDRAHNAMPNGDGLLGGWSSSQAALIVPSPRDSTLFFLFSSQDEATPLTPDRGVVYSVVDMKLAGGFGDVTARNVPVIAPTCEKLVGVRHCNGTEYWVLTHGVGNDIFYAYLVDSAGVVTSPVISHAGAVVSSPRGYLVASSSGRKLAMVVEDPGSLELFDFDNCTGRVSNPVLLTNRDAFYGACFSPDNSKLYAPRRPPSTDIVQIDLSAGNREVVIGHFSQQLYALQLAPDGKIYGTRTRENWLAAINHPNVAGIGCEYVDSALAIGRTAYTGLPNVILGRAPQLYANPAPYDTVICAGSCVRFSDASLGAPTIRRWFFPGGSPSSYSGDGEIEVCYAVPGRYDVVLQVASQDETDSVVQHIGVDMPGAPGVVSVGGMAGAPGDTVQLDLTLAGRGEAWHEVWRPYLVKLRFNRTLLRPLSPADEFADSGEDRVLTLRGGADPRASRLASVRFLVTLGDTDRSAITLDTIAWLGGCPDDLKGSAGEFMLTGLCNTGGERLVRPGGDVALKASQYGDGTLAVDYHLAESGPVRIYLVNMAGEQAAVLVDERFEPGGHSRVIERPALPKGRYLCIMETPTRVLSTGLLIEH